MARTLKTLSEAIQDRRATPSFDGAPLPAEDLKTILEAGLCAPSGYNMQPWRFVVVQDPEQKKRLRAASYNQAKVEEASAMIVAMLQMGLEGGMPEGYAAQARNSVPNFMTSFSSLEMKGWLNKQVMLAFTTMMWMAEAMGYDTAPMEGFEQEKVHELLRLPMSYHVVALLAVGTLRGPDKFDGGRFDMRHTVFGEEFGKPLK
jgi:nitroreductase